jgi:hypothetical protein
MRRGHDGERGLQFEGVVYGSGKMHPPARAAIQRLALFSEQTAQTFAC